MDKIRCIVIHAMKRSGQHAIINWICMQTISSVFLYNLGDRSSEKIATRTFTIYENGDIADHFFKRNKALPNDDPLFPIPTDFRLCVMNFEDEEIETKERFTKSFGYKQNEVLHLIIIRDPYNLFASRRKTYEKWIGGITRWKEHARCCLNNYKYINFNEWVQSKEYRKILAESLNLKFTDKGYDIIPFFGGTAFENLDVLNRYKEYKKLLKDVIDPETVELSKQIFGRIET